MLFVDPLFFYFFAVVWAGHWLLSSARSRIIWLLVASYVFYGAWDYRFLSLIIATSVIDFYLGRRIAEAKNRKVSARPYLYVSIFLNLGSLAFFKYCNFFVESAAAFLNVLGLGVHPHLLNLILPIGISFYTFQSMSYTFDIYMGKIRPEKSLIHFLLFIAFFPQLIAGPIVRAKDFLPQLHRGPRLDLNSAKHSLVLILVGFFKKAVVADLLASLIEPYFIKPGAYNGVTSVLANWAFCVQLYCDFSGYSDIAVGCAGLFGYQIVQNFHFPFLANNIRDVWRRWHTTLNTFLRDYVFFPLGGTSGGLYYRNVAIVMLISAVWHGPQPGFFVWAALTAVLMCTEYYFKTGSTHQEGSFSVIKAFAVFNIVVITIIPFRALTLDSSTTILRGFFFLGQGDQQLANSRLALVLLASAIVHLANYRLRIVERIGNSKDVPFAFSYGAAWMVAFFFCTWSENPFIYFQF